MKYPYWDLDGCDLAATLYGILTPFRLTDHVYKDWDDFERRDPHLAYASTVETRFNNLDDAIISLRTVVQMCGVQAFPVASSVRPIDRYQWIRALVDLALFRISAIRDCTYFLVSETFEFPFTRMDVNLRKLRKREELCGTEILACLEKIALIGGDFREERNARAHQGIQRAIGKGEHATSIFQIASQVEANGTDPLETVKIEEFDLLGEFGKQISEIHQAYSADAEALRGQALVLQELLVDPFCYRYKTKERR